MNREESTMRRFGVIILLIWISWGPVTFESASTVGQNQARLIAPLHPWSVLGLPLGDLVQRKGEGTVVFEENTQEKILSRVDYTETWFGLDQPVKAHYLGSTTDPKTVQQITLNFPAGVTRQELIEQISGFLGEAEQGKSDPSAPAKYFARWLQKGVRYELQDFGEYMEMYILPAWFSGAENYSLPGKTYLMQKAAADVTGDGKNEQVLLLAERFEDTALFLRHIFLVIEDPQSGKGICQRLPEETDGGYDPQMQFHDFNGDGIVDVFLAAATGGSGGLSYYHIYTFADGKTVLLFSTAMKPWISVKGKFLDGYKAEFTIQETNQTHTIDLQNRRSTYEEIKVYRNGKLLEPRELLWLGGYSLITPVDPDGDNIFDLRVIQVLKGVANYDSIAEIISLLHYQDGQWILAKVEVNPAGE